MAGTAIRPALALTALSILIAWPLLLSSPYDLRLFTLAGVFAILVIGYQFIFGYVAELSLAQGAFFGLAAYITGILSVRYGLPFLQTFPLSIVGCVALAGLIAFPVLRLASHYFALATLGIGQALLLLAIDWQSLTNGAIGLPGVPLPNVAGILIGRGWPLMCFVWVMVLIAAGIAYQTKRGLYGLGCHVVRENAIAARALGINPDRLRLTMFLFSAALAGAAGALHAHTIRIVSPEALDFKVMVSCLTMAVIGGRTYIWGAIVGAILIVHLPEWLRGFEKTYLVFSSAILIVILILAPEGLLGLVEKWLPKRVRNDSASQQFLKESHSIPQREDQTLLPSDTPILSVQNLTKTFGGVHALNDLTFNLKRGSITAVIGPNGSGKTTLINCITGIYKADSGLITLANSSVIGVSPEEIAARGVARTFQNLRLVDDMTVLDNVAVARFQTERANIKDAVLKGREDAMLERAHQYAMHMLRNFHIEELAHRQCNSLAHGTKRLVEIARAMCLEPMVLLLDEPAAGLNESEQAELADYLQVLAARGLTLMIIEHNMEFLKTLATDMICLDYGMLIAAGRPSAIYQDERVIEAYIGTGHRTEPVA